LWFQGENLYRKINNDRDCLCAKPTFHNLVYSRASILIKEYSYSLKHPALAKMDIK
jgi:hypothetical protein